MIKQIFTDIQIDDIWEKQKQLDIEIREKNNIPKDRDLIVEKYIALKTEFFEMVNEIESFKFWKKNAGKDNILGEGVDMLHFIFSIAIDNDVLLYMLKEYYETIEEMEGTNMNDLIVGLDLLICDITDKGDLNILQPILSLLLYILQECGFTVQQIYDAYMDKNEVNHERQENNY